MFAVSSRNFIKSLDINTLITLNFRLYVFTVILSVDYAEGKAKDEGGYAS